MRIICAPVNTVHTYIMPTEYYTGFAELSKLSVANDTLVVEPNVFNVTSTGTIVLDAPLITLKAPIIDLGGTTLTNVPTPVGPTDVATREFVETSVSSISSAIKAPISGIYTTFPEGTFSGIGPDAKFVADGNGVGVSVGIRLLFATDTNRIRNGIWVVTSATDTSFEIVRSLDCNQTSDLQSGTAVIMGGNLSTWLFMGFGGDGGGIIGEIDVDGQMWMRQNPSDPSLGTIYSGNSLVVNTDDRFAPTWGADHTWADGKGVASGANRELSMTHAGAGAGGLIKNTAGSLAITNTAGDTVLASEGEDSKTVVVVAEETNLFAVAATQADAADASKRLFAIHNTGAMQVSVSIINPIDDEIVVLPASTDITPTYRFILVNAANAAVQKDYAIKLANGIFGQILTISVQTTVMAAPTAATITIFNIRSVGGVSLSLDNIEGSSVTLLYTNAWHVISMHNKA
jgi:hypothetical protein